VPIPGEAMLDLPRGVVRLYYEVDEGGSGAFVYAPASLAISVRDRSGAEVAVARTSGRSSVHRGLGGTGRSYLGRVEVPVAGPHRMTTTVDGETPVPARLCVGD